MFVSYKYVAKGITVMNRNTLRWILVAIMIMTLVFTLSCPYIVEAEGSALPLNYLEGGKPSKDEGWTFEVKKIQAHRIERMRIYKKLLEEE